MPAIAPWQQQVARSGPKLTSRRLLTSSAASGPTAYTVASHKTVLYARSSLRLRHHRPGSPEAEPPLDRHRHHHLAIGLIKTRLDDTYGPEIRTTYEVIGEPTDVAGAEQLALENKYQFQYWTLGLCGARPTEGIKKGAARGIDGRLFFHEANSPFSAQASKQILFSVKGGQNVGVAEVRDLLGVLQRERADIGAYISFAEPTAPMRREAAEAGFYTSADGSRYPRLQLLTIRGLIEGTQRLERPLHVRDVTFRKAPRSRSAPANNLSLDLST